MSRLFLLSGVLFDDLDNGGRIVFRLITTLRRYINIWKWNWGRCSTKVCRALQQGKIGLWFYYFLTICRENGILVVKLLKTATGQYS